MTMYESNESPPYNTPDKRDITNFIENIQKNMERKHKYNDYDQPDSNNKKPKLTHIDYRDSRKEYSSEQPTSPAFKSSSPCWYLVNGFECQYSSNKCCFSHNPDVITQKKLNRTPELCSDGKLCKYKCRKYHKLYDLQEDFRKCKNIIHNQDAKLYENSRSIKMKDDKIYHFENKISDLQSECMHWRNNYQKLSYDLEQSERRSKAFEKIIINNY